MEHEANVMGSPKVDTREACAFSVDSDGAVIHDEGSAGEVFRRTPEDFERLSVRDLLDPESQSSRAVWAKLARGEGFRGELQLRRGGGAVFLAEVSISKQPDDSFAVQVGGGSLPGERPSIRIERRFGGAGFLRSVDFHLIHNPEGDITRAAPEVGGHLGRNPEAMVGEPISDFIHPDDLAWTGPKLAEARQNPASTVRIEARLRHADGSWRRFEVAVSNLLDDPAAGGIVWHFKDVSEKARVRNDLREGGAQFRAIVEGSQDMITLCSDANTILYASPSYKRILGYDAEEMVGLYVPSVIHPEDLQTAVDRVRELLPDLVLMDVRMPKMDGLEATRVIKSENAKVAVLMVTTYEDPDYLLRAVKAGAAGYLLKDTARREFLAAIRSVLEGDHPLDGGLAMQILRRIGDEKEHSAPLPELEEPLTPREAEILQRLVLGETNPEISRGLHLSQSTVKANLRRVLQKLGVSDRTQAAVRAIKLGLIQAP